jgi:hypothetical protein
LKEGWFVKRHVETGQETELLHNYPINESAVSPDGQRLVFRSYDKPDTTLKTMLVLGGDIREIVRVKNPENRKTATAKTTEIHRKLADFKEKPGCVRTLTFPISSAERQHLLTFSHLTFSFEPDFTASFQGGAVVFVIFACFLKLFSRLGGSL